MTEQLIPDQPKQFIAPQDGEVIICDGINYYLGSQIGQGAFGAIFDCTDEWSNQLVAKVLLPQSKSYDEIKDRWTKELINLKELRHPNITYIHQAFEYRDTFYIIIEKCFCTLFDLINGEKFNGELWLPYVARDILHGLDYIHTNNYTHKDLHAGNIFVSQQYDFMVPTKDPVWSFKIGDLGISKLEDDVEWFNTILAQWMLPPEFIEPVEFGNPSRNIDMYHVGLLLLSMLVKPLPNFTHLNIIEGKPRLLAESLKSPYGSAIAKALRRHVDLRTQSAIEMWRDISHAMPQQP